MTPQRQLRQYKEDWFLFRTLCIWWGIIAAVAAVTAGPSVAWGCCIIISLFYHVLATRARRGWVFAERAVWKSQETLDNRYVQLVP